jgi:hypothetical protein
MIGYRRKQHVVLFGGLPQNVLQHIFLIRVQTARYAKLVDSAAVVAPARLARILRVGLRSVVAAARRQDLVTGTDEAPVVDYQDFALHGIATGFGVVGGVVLLQSAPDERLGAPHGYDLVGVQEVALAHIAQDAVQQRNGEDQA